MENQSTAIQWTNRSLFRLLWPLIVEQLLAVSIGMVDTLMVTAVGESAVSGVSLVDSINILLITAFAALATGGAVVCSQYLGRNDGKNASVAARQLVYITTLVALVLAVLAIVLRRGILTLIYGHIAADVMQNADTYLWLSALSYPFIALYNAGAALFRSMGNSRVGMLVALMVNLLNIGGNSLLIFGFDMGVAGAAISTLISRAVAAVVLVVMLVRRQTGPITLAGLHRFQFIPSMIRRILRIGVPTGLENSMFQIGKLLVARVVSTFGTSAIAGNAIAMSIGSIASIPGMGFGMALLTVVGQCTGAGDYEAVRRNTKKLLFSCHGMMLVICSLLLIFRLPLLGMFNLSPQATQLAGQLLVVFLIPAPFFWPESFTLPNALRAAGDARYPLVVSILSMWIFRIGCSFLLAYTMQLGVMGVWYAMLADWLVRGGCFSWRWIRGRWQQNQLI